MLVLVLRGRFFGTEEKNLEKTQHNLKFPSKKEHPSLSGSSPVGWTANHYRQTARLVDGTGTHTWLCHPKEVTRRRRPHLVLVVCESSHCMCAISNGARACWLPAFYLLERWDASSSFWDACGDWRIFLGRTVSEGCFGKAFDAIAYV